ncbi:prepilin-type N-terminal cleavage/methylation domain-containing protein [Gracilibacillus caseinilyticus]|uniref:Prepilin-type N-terminal cleavage/methylation domain-containing protein n=1 Tax=Gracilibacillus caseinilyticus TaxID=2932256 RepID=A0ABY4ETI1_9BACI|nr:prepilin-type N-terminal cleavage/methylation domain-containing protein [Gracilibacillus caseinilyticus]UOQ47285.1 prepilin-type N-terminal cleavage/methylation domain-containing protein [Gracilibacillus caseinilyticus]
MRNISQKESGFTLIEMLASITILSIISFGFIAIFVHASKTTETSADIIDADYIAQTEMERIYQYSTESAMEDTISLLETDGYQLLNRAEETFQLEKSTRNHYIRMKVEKDQSVTDFWMVSVQVLNERDDHTVQAVLEAGYVWCIERFDHACSKISEG